MTKKKQTRLLPQQKRVAGKEPSKFPKQTVINWVKYYLKEQGGGKKVRTQITSRAVDEVIARIEILLEYMVTYHQEHQVKQPNRRGISIFEEDVVDFFNKFLRDTQF